MCQLRTQYIEKIYRPKYYTMTLKSRLSITQGHYKREGNLRPRRPPREYLGEYTSWGKPKIPPVDRILMDPGHKARKNPSDNADLGFQTVGPALRSAHHAAQRRGVVSSKTSHMHTRKRRLTATTSETRTTKYHWMSDENNRLRSRWLRQWRVER